MDHDPCDPLQCSESLRWEGSCPRHGEKRCVTSPLSVTQKSIQGTRSPRATLSLLCESNPNKYLLRGFSDKPFCLPYHFLSCSLLPVLAMKECGLPLPNDLRSSSHTILGENLLESGSPLSVPGSSGCPSTGPLPYEPDGREDKEVRGRSRGVTYLGTSPLTLTVGPNGGSRVGYLSRFRSPSFDRVHVTQNVSWVGYGRDPIFTLLSSGTVTGVSRISDTSSVRLSPPQGNRFLRYSSTSGTRCEDVFETPNGVHGPSSRGWNCTERRTTVTVALPFEDPDPEKGTLFYTY